MAASTSASSLKIDAAVSPKEKVTVVREAIYSLGPLAYYDENGSHALLRHCRGALSAYQHALVSAGLEAKFKKVTMGLTYTATEEQVRFLVFLGATRKQLDGLTEADANELNENW